MPIIEPLTGNITVAIEALESLHIDWKGIWKIIYEAVKQYKRINNERITKPTQIKDAKVNPLNKLQRPYFSPKLGSWEIDLVFVVIPMIEKSAAQIKIALKKLI
ncbi:MAG: hypothetical protein EZS28_009354 [Streblomastix strix]|uniref:Uncharacterized protein n=1 Tax=Streblomastix strix TaxID=222440 RepID=A0A5J4WL67_9EUKA|nr:MAG: hypothetical protein EZS28_009354 [Streblomastix strix]